MPEAKRSAVVRSGEAAWRPLPAAGISIKVLRDDQETGQPTALPRPFEILKD